MEKMERTFTQKPMMKCSCSGGNNTRLSNGVMATRCSRRRVQPVIIDGGGGVMRRHEEQGLCRHPFFIKEDKSQESITTCFHVVFQTASSPRSRGTKIQMYLPTFWPNECRLAGAFDISLFPLPVAALDRRPVANTSGLFFS